MSIPEEKIKYTYGEYLALEDQAEYKSEYYDGEIFAMGGGTEDHSLIAANVIGEVRAALKSQDCRMYTSDFRIRIEGADAGVYPDAMVICGQREYYQDRKDVVTNPTVVFEVLSESTKEWDYIGKFRKYQLLPSLQEYVLIEQKEPRVDVFRRTDQGLWMLEGYAGMDAVAEFKSIGVSVSLSEIYYQVEF